MSYEAGTLRISKVQVYDSRSDETYPKGCIYLPHSCDNWMIGGQADAENLLADLHAFLAGDYVPKEEEAEEGDL